MDRVPVFAQTGNPSVHRRKSRRVVSARRLCRRRGSRGSPLVSPPFAPTTRGAAKMTNAAFRCALRILLVDDEPDLYLASAEWLRDAGHEVHTAHDGDQAFELMTSLKFDVVLTDIRLPKLDGLSLFRLAREHSPATTVILVTACAEVDEGIAAVKEGVHDELMKQVS